MQGQPGEEQKAAPLREETLAHLTTQPPPALLQSSALLNPSATGGCGEKSSGEEMLAEMSTAQPAMRPFTYTPTKPSNPPNSSEIDTGPPLSL